MRKLNTLRRMGWCLQANPVAIFACSMVLAVLSVKVMEFATGNPLNIYSFLFGMVAYSVAAANLIVAPAWGLYYVKAIQRDYGPQTSQAVVDLFARHQEEDLNIPALADDFGELRRSNI